LSRCVVTVFIASIATVGITAGDAYAKAEILPNTINKYKSESGVVKLETLAKNVVDCKKATAEGTVEPGTAKGPFHITFSECESEGFVKAKCKTSGDAEGVILSLGTWKFVHDVNSTGTTWALLFEVPAGSPTEFECTSFFKLKVSGTVLCLVLEPEVSRASHEFHCKNNGTVGDPQESKYWFELNEPGEGQTASLLTFINNGGGEMSAENGLGHMLTFVNAVETASAVMG
jgi:hypothetical protein